MIMKRHHPVKLYSVGNGGHISEEIVLVDIEEWFGEDAIGREFDPEVLAEDNSLLGLCEDVMGVDYGKMGWIFLDPSCGEAVLARREEARRLKRRAERAVKILEEIEAEAKDDTPDAEAAADFIDSLSESRAWELYNSACSLVTMSGDSPLRCRTVTIRTPNGYRMESQSGRHDGDSAVNWNEVPIFAGERLMEESFGYASTGLRKIVSDVSVRTNAPESGWELDFPEMCECKRMVWTEHGCYDAEEKAKVDLPATCPACGETR